MRKPARVYYGLLAGLLRRNTDNVCAKWLDLRSAPVSGNRRLRAQRRLLGWDCWAGRKGDRLKPALRFADRDGMGEKRAEPRIPLMARVDVLWTDGEQAPRVAPATLEDKSDSGFGVRMKEPVPAGAHVTVKRGSEQVSGTVTHCRRDKAYFVIGVKREPKASPAKS
jgi:hypothetical protein